MFLAIAIVVPPTRIFTKKETFSKVLVTGALKSEILASRIGGWRLIGDLKKPVLLSEKDDPVDPNKPMALTKTVILEVPEVAFGLLLSEVMFLLLCTLALLFLLRKSKVPDNLLVKSESEHWS
jgi:hypothetical protein